MLSFCCAYNWQRIGLYIALREAISEFEIQTESYEENIIILITDGQPNGDGDPCDEVDRLNAAGIDVYVVGVSSEFNKHTFECLVPSDKVGMRILTIPQIQASMFWAMEAKLRQVVCPIVIHDAYTTLAIAMFGDY